MGAGKVACELVDESVAVYGNTDPRAAATGTDPLGTTCTYEGQSNKFVALVTDGPGTGLADVDPRVPDATVTDRRLGELPARQEDAGTTCALSVEFIPGRIFTITYQHDRAGLGVQGRRGGRCGPAHRPDQRQHRVSLAGFAGSAAIANLIDSSSTG